MKIKLVSIGKTDANYLKEGVEIYTKRMKHYNAFEIIEIPDLKKTKNLSEAQQKTMEGDKILKMIAPTDKVVLLDEKGKEFNSEGFASFFDKNLNQSVKTLVFVIGGPYGFSKEMYSRADQKIALSQMTFSHQMIRLFIVEQIYRAFTILKGEPYHHK